MNGEHAKLPRSQSVVAHPAVLTVESRLEKDDFYFPKSLEDDVNLWTPDDVLRFLRLGGLEDVCGERSTSYLG